MPYRKVVINRYIKKQYMLKKNARRIIVKAGKYIRIYAIRYDNVNAKGNADNSLKVVFLIFSSFL